MTSSFILGSGIFEYEKYIEQVKQHQKESGHTGQGESWCSMCALGGYYG